MLENDKFIRRKFERQRKTQLLRQRVTQRLQELSLTRTSKAAEINQQVLLLCLHHIPHTAPNMAGTAPGCYVYRLHVLSLCSPQLVRTEDQGASSNFICAARVGQQNKQDRQGLSMVEELSSNGHIS